MLSMLASLAIAAPLPQDALEVVRQLREEGRYAAALEAADEVEDPALAAFERMETLYWAGDLGGALRAGLAGLDHDPQHVWLLWRASRLAIDLATAERAVELTRRFTAAIDTAEGIERAAWAETARAFEGEADALARAAERRDGSVARARAVVLSIGVVAAVALALLGRRA